MKYGRPELYNITKDIKEEQGLTKKFPDKTKEMAKLLTEKLKEENGQMPAYKETAKPAPYPDEVLLQ